MTLCNINQGRSSLFHEYGLADNKTLLQAVLGQAYFGSQKELSEDMVRTSNSFKFMENMILYLNMLQISKCGVVYLLLYTINHKKASQMFNKGLNSGHV